MVNLLRGGNPAFLGAHRAKGVLGDVPRPDALPCPAIPLVCFRVALIFVVMGIYGLLVLLAIPAIGKRRAAGIATRTFGFSRHITASFARKKALRAAAPKAFCFSTPTFYHRKSQKSSAILDTFICHRAAWPVLPGRDFSFCTRRNARFGIVRKSYQSHPAGHRRCKRR